MFFSPFSISITSLGEKRANLSVFCAFVRFALIWFSSSSWCLGRAAACDCGTPWTFLLPSLLFVYTIFLTTSFSIRSLLFVHTIFFTTFISNEVFAVCLHYILDNFHFQWGFCCFYTLYFWQPYFKWGLCCLYTLYFWTTFIFNEVFAVCLHYIFENLIFNEVYLYTLGFWTIFIFNDVFAVCMLNTLDTFLLRRGRYCLQ